MTTVSHTFTGVALLLNFGKQWIFSKTFSLDIYIGAGYALAPSNSGNSLYYDNYTGNYFSYITTGPDFPLALSGGMNIGIAIP